MLGENKFVIRGFTLDKKYTCNGVYEFCISTCTQSEI